MFKNGRMNQENRDIELVLKAVSAAGLALGGVALFLMSSELKQLRRQVQRQGLRVQLDCESDSICCYSASGSDLATGSAVYVWRQNRWELESDRSEPGYETTPPKKPGAYELQAIRKPSVPVMC